MIRGFACASERAGCATSLRCGLRRVGRAPRLASALPLAQLTIQTPRHFFGQSLDGALSLFPRFSGPLGELLLKRAGPFSCFAQLLLSNQALDDPVFRVLGKDEVRVLFDHGAEAGDSPVVLVLVLAESAVPVMAVLREATLVPCLDEVKGV